MTVLLIKNCNLVDIEKEKIIKTDLLIEDGLIKEIKENIETFEKATVINGEGKYLFPGLVDIHAHFREPGFEHKETIKTGAMAAAKGGYTTVFIMPNTRPVIDDLESINYVKGQISKNSIINVYPIAAVTKGQLGKELTDMKLLYQNGAYGFSDDGQPIMNPLILENGMFEANRLGVPIMLHNEDKRLVGMGCINEGYVSNKLCIHGIPREAENNMIKRDLNIAKKLGLKAHFCHISTKEAVKMIRKAKSEGVTVTCEVTPHHFSLTDKIVETKMSIAKVNPPLRTKEDIEEIILGIQDGTIDAIATDHAPHSKEEKKMDIYNSPFGISGIELALSITITNLLKKGYIDIIKMAKLMALNPSIIMGIKRGRLKVGDVADMTLVDIDDEFILKEEDLVSMGKNTPFVGQSLFGKVKYTIVSGKIVYRGDTDVCR